MATAGQPVLLDTKLLDKPRNYNGSPKDWQQFKYVFKAYIGAISTCLFDNLEHAERNKSEVLLRTMLAGHQRQARTLSYVLAQVLTGSALQLVMNAEQFNGFESWWRLEEPTGGTAQVAQLSALLRPLFSGQVERWGAQRIERLFSKLQHFEGGVQNYENVHSDVLPDSPHQALFLASLSELKKQQDLTVFTSVGELKSTISSYVQNQVATRGLDVQTSTDMEVGWLGGRRGKTR